MTRCWIRTMALVSAVTVAGCGGGSSGSERFGLDARPALAPLAFPTGTAQSGDVAIVNAFPSLSFDQPLFVAAPPGDGARLFVVSQTGLISVLANDPAATVAKTFLDLRAKVTQSGGEMGLLGLAFDPGYASNGRFYVNYNPPFTGTSSDSCGASNPATACRTVISRFTVSSGDPDAADPASETPLLGYQQPYTNHKGGWLGFGPDGKLYVAAGDGGSGGDPRGNGQNLGSLLGKILRINANGSVPADNPFVSTPGARGEIWAYGLRNPFRASFDASTGTLWAGDVGQNAYEEIDRITRGGNYGWNVREGLHGYPTASTPKPAGNNFIDPLLEYDHSQGCSVIGGTVYRGGAIPALAGSYVYSDYCSATIWAAAVASDGTVINTALATAPGNPSSFGSDDAGELYLTGIASGAIYKLVAGSGGGSASVPQLLSQTGLFGDTANLLPNPGLIEYTINAGFWSDGARKRRWFAVPDGQTIGFSASEAWSFPVGSVTVKEFEITLADGSTRRLETRVFVHTVSGWQGYTYKWNGAGTDAALLSTAETETINTASGPQTYEWPSRAACATCHNAAAGVVLGLRSPQLNRDQAYAAGTDNQLRALNHVGLFDHDIGGAAQYPALTDPTDASAVLALRARAYLDTNCAQCHRPGGPTPVDIDLRATTAIGSTNTVNVAPSAGDLGIAGARRITPGQKETSLVWARMNRLDGNRMPNLASHAIDEAGVALVGAWIDAGAR